MPSMGFSTDAEGGVDAPLATYCERPEIYDDGHEYDSPASVGGAAIRRALLRRVHYGLLSRRVRYLYAGAYGSPDKQLVPLFCQDYESEADYVVAHAVG